jgi:hypothetical protein
LHVTAVDVDTRALELAEELARDLVQLPGVPIELRTLPLDLRWSHAELTERLSPPYDFIVIGLALNELRGSGDEASAARAAAERLVELSSLLAHDGVLVVLEPALRETSRFLHAVRDVLAARDTAPWVFAPCLRRAACPMLARERDFCHERVPFQLPPRVAALAAQAGRRDADLTYSYLTLHAAPRTLRERHAAPLFRVVSGALPSKGKLELWLCGEDAAPRAMRLDRHASAANRGVELAGRGALVRIDPTDEAQASAERLRIGPETRVELIQGWNPEP